MVVIDASAKIPDGLFLGNTHVMGAFDECLNLETPSLLKWKNDEFIEGFRYFFIHSSQYVMSIIFLL